jgi:hypothetical protein
MAALLATPAQARTALRVLSSFLGTDFVHGALNPFAAASYTAAARPRHAIMGLCVLPR